MNANVARPARLLADETVRDAALVVDEAAAAITASDEDAAWVGYHAAAEMTAGASNGTALHARALAGLAGIAMSRGERRQAAGFVRRAEAVLAAGSTPDPLAVVDVQIAASEVVMDASASEQSARRAVEAVGRIADQAIGRDAEMRASRALGNALRAAGRFRAAERALRQAARAADVHGADSVELAGVLNDIGVVLKFAGRFDEAARRYAAVEAIQDGAGLAESADRATLLHNLGGLLHARGRYAEAELPARQALELHARTLGLDHHATDLDRVALASIVDQLGRSDEAESLLRAALPRLRSRLGRDREVAVALTNLGAIAQRRGELDDAEASYREALAIKEETAGPESPSLAGTLNNLGTVLRRRGQAVDARAAYERALEVLGESVEADHPLRRTIESNLARVPDPRHP